MKTIVLEEKIIIIQIRRKIVTDEANYLKCRQDETKTKTENLKWKMTRIDVLPDQ